MSTQIIARNSLKVHAMKAYRGSSGIAPLILNLDTRGIEWLASRPGRFTPRKEAGWAFWRTTTILPLSEFEPRTARPVT